MRRSTARRSLPPLRAEQLHELALRYVGRYATTRAKLAAYLGRKLRERGWDGGGEPPVAQLVERFARSGLVDDAAFAMAKSRSLVERGYGAGRVRQALRAAGVDEEDGREARELAAAEAASAALRFARRRRIGPFATATADPKTRERALAAMVRAGHAFEIARRLVDCRPGEAIDAEELAARFR
ncbi:MAG TPA: RecX family transcriptional regulator [Sphingomicrobium sp.]|nr:RecX family transcriptional regulator [Sphingomicrobium sp.]